MPLSYMDVPRDVFRNISRKTNPRSQGRLFQTTRRLYYDQDLANDRLLALQAESSDLIEQERHSVGHLAKIQVELTVTHPNFRVVYTGSRHVSPDNFDEIDNTSGGITEYFLPLIRHNAFVNPEVHPLAPSEIFFENNWYVHPRTDPTPAQQ